MYMLVFILYNTWKTLWIHTESLFFFFFSVSLTFWSAFSLSVPWPYRNYQAIGVVYDFCFIIMLLSLSVDGNSHELSCKESNKQKNLTTKKKS